MPRVVARASASSSQMSWTSASPNSVPKNVWVTRSCGSRCISSSEIPPSSATVGSRTWSVRRPASDLGGVGGEQGGRRRSPGPAASYSAELARRPSPRATGSRPTSATATSAEQLELEPARPRADRPEDARERRRARGSGRARGVRSPERSLEPHPDLADLELVAEAHRRDAVDAPAVDVRAVRAAEVLQVPAPASIGQDGVVGRRERVVDHDRVVDVTTERGDDVEAERMAGGRLAARRLEDDQPARADPPARARRRAGRAAVPGSTRYRKR